MDNIIHQVMCLLPSMFDDFTLMNLYVLILIKWGIFTITHFIHGDVMCFDYGVFEVSKGTYDNNQSNAWSLDSLLTLASPFSTWMGSKKMRKWLNCVTSIHSFCHFYFIIQLWPFLDSELLSYVFGSPWFQDFFHPPRRLGSYMYALPYSNIKTRCFKVRISLLRKETNIKITFVFRSHG